MELTDNHCCVLVLDLSILVEVFIVFDHLYYHIVFGSFLIYGIHNIRKMCLESPVKNLLSFLFLTLYFLFKFGDYRFICEGLAEREQSIVVAIIEVGDDIIRLDDFLKQHEAYHSPHAADLLHELTETNHIIPVVDLLDVHPVVEFIMGVVKGNLVCLIEKEVTSIAK